MKIAVVGLGLIGGSLALDLKACGFAQRAIGVDASPRHADEALALGLVDEVLPLEKAAPLADLAILAAPVDANLEALRQALPLLSPGATIVDMGSTKESICRAVAGHARRAQFVPTHPMTGTENSGPSAALRGLFNHKTAVICEPALSGAAHLERARAMYRALRMRVIELPAADHDRHAAFVSHLSHISSFVLANTVLAEEQNADAIFDLAGGGFESTVRLAKSSPAMWGPIFEQNHGHVMDALEAYIAHLQAFHSALARRDRAQIVDRMEDANRIRRVLATMQARKDKA
jgi:prephenate dehydrogenase